MAVQAVAAQPEAQRVAAFQTADAVTDNDMYSAAMNKANEAFRTHYKQELSQHAVEMDALTVTWTSTQATATADDLAARVDLVIEWAKKRDDATTALKKIEDAYTAAIAYCQPPVLDVATIKTLRKMNVNIQQMEALFVKLFTTQLGLMVTQKEKVMKLSAEVEAAYKNMKRALEPTAARIDGSAVGSFLYGSVWSTPYVDARRDARLKALDQADQADHKDQI